MGGLGLSALRSESRASRLQGPVLKLQALNCLPWLSREWKNGSNSSYNAYLCLVGNGRMVVIVVIIHCRSLS